MENFRVRSAVATFPLILARYNTLSPTLKETFHSCDQILSSKDSTKQEFDAALDTMIEIIFPSNATDV